MNNGNGRKKEKEPKRVEDLTNETRIAFIPRGKINPIEITGRIEMIKGIKHFLYHIRDVNHSKMKRSLSPRTVVL